MSERREHYISAALAEKPKDNLRFSKVIHEYKDEFLAKSIKNDLPPPEREVVLVLSGSEYQQLLVSSLERVYGIIFEKDLLFNGTQARPDFLLSFKGIIARALRDNKNIQHYGLTVGLYVDNGSMDELKYIYGIMDNLCKGITKDVNVDFELIRGSNHLQVYLESELFRIVHGDIEMQMVSLSS